MRFVCAVLIGATMVGVPPQKFTSAGEGVRADVLVVDGRRPVAGLTADNFELRDSGVVQQIESVSFEDVPLSVMLAFDTSNSVNGLPLRHLKEAASAVVRLLQRGDRAAVITFTGTLNLRSPWTSDHAVLDRAINETTASGSTTLHDAAYAALTLRDTEPGRPLVLIFSDGADTASWLPGSHVVEIARRNEAVVYAVTLPTSRRPGVVELTTSTGEPVYGYRLDFRSGIQRSVDPAPTATLMEPFLNALAKETGGKVLNAGRSDRLRQTFVQIVKEFRSRYLITYTPRGVDRGGWHPLEVSLKGRKGQVTARRGYLR